MTECSTDAIQFSSVDRRRVVADFLGGRLTSDAGILLLKEVDRKIGLIDAIDQAIPDPRDHASMIHDQRTMLAQRIFSIALGYEDLNDQQTMRTDAALQVAAGVDAEEDNPMASPSTLCRLENRVFRKTLVRLSRILVDQFIASYETPPAEITLDFDATDDRRSWRAGRSFLSWILPTLLFFAAVRFLRKPAVGGLSSAEQNRRSQTCQSDHETACGVSSPTLAGREDYDPRGRWLWALETDALVRKTRCFLLFGHVPQPGA